MIYLILCVMSFVELYIFGYNKYLHSEFACVSSYPYFQGDIIELEYFKEVK